MLEKLTGARFAVHLSPGLVVLEKDGVLWDYQSIAAAYHAIFLELEE